MRVTKAPWALEAVIGLLALAYCWRHEKCETNKIYKLHQTQCHHIYIYEPWDQICVRLNTLEIYNLVWHKLIRRISISTWKSHQVYKAFHILVWSVVTEREIERERKWNDVIVFALQNIMFAQNKTTTQAKSRFTPISVCGARGRTGLRGVLGKCALAKIPFRHTYCIVVVAHHDVGLVQFYFTKCKHILHNPHAITS